MSHKNREFWIDWARDPMDNDKVYTKIPKMYVDRMDHVIEYSAYQALEQKLTIAIEALQKYKLVPTVEKSKEWGSVGVFTADRALALINVDTKK
jgi:hypothetical protein